MMKFWRCMKVPILGYFYLFIYLFIHLFIYLYFLLQPLSLFKQSRSAPDQVCWAKRTGYWSRVYG